MGEDEDAFACEYGKGFVEGGSYKANPMEHEAYEFTCWHAPPGACMHPWMVSYSDTGQWQQINGSGCELADLALADLTTGGKTDVFALSPLAP